MQPKQSPAGPLQLRDRTPKPLACIVGGCPAVFETQRGTFVLIGRCLSEEERAGIQGRIGEGEMAIEVPRELLLDLNEE